MLASQSAQKDYLFKKKQIKENMVDGKAVPVYLETETHFACTGWLLLLYRVQFYFALVAMFALLSSAVTCGGRKIAAAGF